MTEPNASIPQLNTHPKLSQEPGFLSVDLAKLETVRIPSRAPGLLAFLYVEGDAEFVFKILMLDNLAKGFAANLPFSGRANRIAYYVFPEASDFDLRVIALNERLKLYAALTEKYNSPQQNRALNDFKNKPAK